MKACMQTKLKYYNNIKPFKMYHLLMLLKCIFVVNHDMYMCVCTYINS